MAKTKVGVGRPRVNDAERTVKTSISIEHTQYDKIIKYCETEERTLSWVVRKALDQWIENNIK